MAIIYSYPTVLPAVSDLVLGTDVSGTGNPTKNFTVQSLVDLIAGGAAGLGAVLTIGNDAQDANGVNQSAVNFGNIQGTGSVTFGSFTDGTMNIINGIGTAFTSFQSTSFTGKLDAASFNQNNIRTLGILTDLKVGNATPAITSIATVFANPGDDIKLATTKAIVDYIATKPNPETLAETLANGNTTADTTTFPQGNDIIISGRGDGAAGNKLIFNSAQTSIEFKNNNFLGATISKAQNDNVVFTSEVNSGGYQFIGDEFRVNSQVGTPNELMILAAQNFGVKLYHNGIEKLDTTSTGITVSGAVSAAVGSNSLPSYTFTGDLNTGMFHPGDDEIGFSTQGSIRLKVSDAGINVTGIIDATGLIEGLSFTTDTTLSKTPMTRFVKSTDPSNPVTNPATTGISAANLQVDTMVPTVLAVKNYADIVAGAKTLEYEGDTTGPFALNLTDDNFKIEGGTNIGTVATNVATNVGTLTVNLDDSVTITGTMKADTFTTTAGTATWVTTVLAGFTKITSALFVGNSAASLLAPIPPNAVGTPNNVQFQGNASSANRLGPSDGTIQLLIGSGDTLGVSSIPVKYTDGGDITITTSLLNTIVTGKTLQGLPTPAAETVVAADTILEGFGKLQSQINGLANGLQFQGTWNANTDEGGAGAAPNGTPALTSGGGEASSGTTDATTANELVDSTKDFTVAPNVVAVNDKVINQADGQTALVTSIANAASGRLGIGADIMLTNEAYIIDKSPFKTAGHYYVVNAVGATTAQNATLNGIQDWQIGDWVIASTTNVWQKLNNSAVEGSGTENRLPKWTAAVSTLVDSGIIDNGTTIKLENDTELGSVAGDTIKSVGIHTIDEQLILKKGLGVGATPDYGDSTNKVLTSGNGSINPPAWVNRSTWGYIENVIEGTGITVSLNADSTDATVNVDYLGADNVILEATSLTAGAAIPSSAQIMFNDNTAGANTVSYAPISSLPFTPAVSGTQYTIPMFATNTTLGDSVISQDLTGIATVTIGSALKMGFHIFMDNNKIKEISELSFGANAYITSPSNFLVRFNQTSVDIPSGNLTVGTIDNATTDTDKFLVSDSGVIKYRTGAEVLSDIGAAPATGGAYLPLAGGTLTGPLTGTDATFSGNVSLADDKSLTLGTGVDSKIFFDNAASVLADSTVIQSTPTAGTGTILLQSYNVKMRDQLGTSNMFHATRYGVTLYYDGDVKFTTTSSGVNLNGFGSGTKTGTAAYNLGVDSAGDVIETNANPGGSGGGIFSGDQAIAFPPPTLGDKAFTLNRATTGTLIFDVWFTSETSTDTSVAKKYTVAHANNGTPVYNKIIDTGPKSTGYANNDFTVSFVNAGSGLSVECYIVAGSIAQNIGYTVQVGHDSTNALTFTPAS